MTSCELARRIAFARSRGVKVGTASAILERIGGMEAFAGTVPADAAAAAQAEADFVTRKRVDALFYTDTDFPRRLLDCEDAPAMLFRLGACDLNPPRVVAVVGTRNATVYGLRFTDTLIRGLAESLPGTLIVSGLAYGIDVQAHRTALDCGLPTAGVVGHGLKTIYPAEHRTVAAKMVREGGALLTEYTSDETVHRSNFLARNRIVAGMADVLVLVESDVRGGAMVTANLADSYNRDVCVAPGRTTDRYSAGPNALLVSRKASLIRNADDLIRLMNWDDAVAPATPPPALPLIELSEEKSQILEYIRSHPDATLDELARALATPYPAMSARVMEMEMDDLIASTPSGTFFPIDK